jgi:periplasmic protein CpxP/Spy
MKPFVKRSLIATAILAGIVGVSATAIAQGMGQHGGMDPQHQAQHMGQRGQGPQAGDAKQWEARRAERMEQMVKRHAEHQTQLKSALKITASQEAAWNAYVAGTAPNPPANAPGMAREDWSKLSTPQRLDKMQAFRAERDAAMAKRIETVKTFYAALTPEQQKVFDTQAHGGFHRAGMKGEHRMGGKGGHGGQGGHGDRHGMGMGAMKGGQGGMGCDGPGAKAS